MDLKDPLGKLRRTVQRGLDTLEERSKALVRSPQADLTSPAELPPVVARLMVEIRSDGTRTIARGAIEDVSSGDKVTLEAKGTTPAQLAASLAKSLLTVPLLARQAVQNFRTAQAEANTASRLQEKTATTDADAATQTEPSAGRQWKRDGDSDSGDGGA